MQNLSKIPVLGLVIAAVALCTAAGFYVLFSNFRAYDDEGVLLLANQLFLDGGSFYTDIPWMYGPGYLAIVRLFNDFMAVPLTHSAVRYTTLCYWLLLCAVSGLLIYKLSRSVLWSIVAFALVFLFTQAIANEPGHPQGLIAAITLLIPLAACSSRLGSKTLLWFFIGALTSAIFHIKVNAGVYSLAAVAVVLVLQFPVGRWQKLLTAVVVTASVGFPFALMLPLLPEPNALPFACILALGLGSTTLILGSERSPDINSKMSSIALVLGFSFVTVLAFTFAGVNGATPFDIFASLFIYSSSQIEFYHFFREYTAFQLASASASFALALWYCLSNSGANKKQLVVLGKIYFVSLVVYSITINDPAHAQVLLAYAGPWCWLLACKIENVEYALGRLLLANIAVWSPLLAYPVPGSQIYFGSLAIVLAAVVCGADLVAAVSRHWYRTDSLKALALERRVPFLVTVVVLIILAISLKQAREEYYRFKPLGLSGTQLIRIEPRRGYVYREIVKELNGADVALTTFRFNSFYLWSSAEMAGPLYLAHSLAYSLPIEQISIKAALMSAINPIVVKRKAPDWAEEPQTDILVWIEDNFESYRKIGRYTLMKPRGDHSVEPE